ncbi:MAG: hypothetical protein HQ448_12690 [Cytophagales bacterium]|jgi:hypothetical protein|nr:hypothetical protein [Cytophagales bacterium]
MNNFKGSLRIICALCLLTICFPIAYYIRFKKERYYSNGGFIRTYLPIKSQLLHVSTSNKNIYRFSNSSNSNYVLGFRENSFLKLTFSGNILREIPVRGIIHYPNNAYFNDDINNNMYIVTNNTIVTKQVIGNNHANYKTKSTVNFNSNLFEPLIFNNNKIICLRALTKKWAFQFQNLAERKNNVKEHLVKLVDQGEIKFNKQNKTFIYVSLFSNEIVQYDTLFNIIHRAKTIDTVATKPRVTEYQNSMIFSSPPRVTNYDFFISKDKLFVRSIVKSNNDVDFKKKVVFDIYKIDENFKYVGSFFINKINTSVPTDMHMLNNNILLLLYENSIEIFKIKL